MKRDVRFVTAVDVPYERVRDRLRDEPESLLGSAAEGAIVTTLHAHLGRRRVSRDMRIELVAFDEPLGAASGAHLLFRADASRNPDLFPHLEARLDAVPIAAERTALLFSATYKPPLGLLGGAVDAAVLHRFAEESLSRFLDDVAVRLGPTGTG